MDLRRAAGLTLDELSQLSGIGYYRLREMEAAKPDAAHRPGLQFILAIRKLEAVFEEELVRYLAKPHQLISVREGHAQRLEPYGGYKTTRVWWRKRRCWVSFTGRSFADIREMGDVAAIRALKVVATGAERIREAGREYAAPAAVQARRDAGSRMGRIMEAVSRGTMLDLDEIRNLLENGEAQRAG